MKRTAALLLALAMLLCGVTALALERDAWLSADQFYYQQLSPEHKAAWENDIANALSYPEQTKAAQDRRHQALACMIKADNPRSGSTVSIPKPSCALKPAVWRTTKA